MAAPAAYKTKDIRGPRGALSADKARELLADVLEGRVTDYERLVLSTWAFSEESARVAADAIAKLPRLVSACVADTIAGRPEAEGLAVYHVLSDALHERKLREIDLSDNAVGTKGVLACTRMFADQTELETVHFKNCGISAEAFASIADLLLFRTPTKLKALHFDNNMSGPGGGCALADIVRGSPELETLQFSTSRCSEEGGLALARVLAGSTSLRNLDFHDNIFNVRACKEIGRSLRSMTALENVNLSDILMKDAGVAAVASGLVRGSRRTIRTLDLSMNEITDEGMVHVAKLVRRLPALESLTLNENEFDEVGCRYLALAFQERAQSLDLGDKDPLAHVHLRGVCTSSGALSFVANMAAEFLPNLATFDVTEVPDLTAVGVRRIEEVLASRGLGHVLKASEPEEEGDEEEFDQEFDADEGVEAQEPDSDLEEDAEAAVRPDTSVAARAAVGDVDAIVDGIAEALEGTVRL